MNLEEKRQIAQRLHEQLAKSVVVIVTDYKGLNVAAITDLRKKLKEVQVDYKVVKNTLLRRAAEETEAALIVEGFKGPSAVALSYEDPVAPAKVLTDFAKQNAKLEIKLGVMNSKVLDVEAIKALASMPSREELLAKLLSTMNGVPRALVTALSDVPRRMLNVLNAIKEQKEAA